LPSLVRIRNALDHCGAAERDTVKEAQGADRNIEAGPGRAGGGKVDLIGPDVRQPQPIRRAVEVLGEFSDRVHVTSLRRRRQIAHLHILDHAAAQWIQLGHRRPPVGLELRQLRSCQPGRPVFP